ncbi:MAG: glyoxylate reductase [Actinomycetota bacterium]|nr:glyoxylate reductase [Actinomycetota bacterium]
MASVSKAQIVSSVPLDSPHLDRLREWELTVTDLARASRVDVSEALCSAEGLLVNSHVGLDESMLELAPRLRVISTVSVGFDHIDIAVAGRRAITVTTTPVLSDAVADLTLALILMTSRRLREGIEDLGRGVWNNALLGSDVRGKFLLIVGLGRIGREVAARAQACKMRVCAFDLRSDLPEIVGVERVESLAEGLMRADFVSLHVDLNRSTRHLLDDSAFALMKPSSIVINTSRGGVVDQAALTRALLDRRIGGAGLDVLELEPPDAADPLLRLPNVVVLPHIGSATTETRRAMLDCAVDNLAECMRGDACEHVLRF